ncbi:bacteriohemerythrin [Noviherbaspirillum sp. UKPF54]|nr:bacteriohemerythrin [Noviherbaspirillum sp. UKPF54]
MNIEGAERRCPWQGLRRQSRPRIAEMFPLCNADNNRYAIWTRLQRRNGLRATGPTRSGKGAVEVIMAIKPVDQLDSNVAAAEDLRYYAWTDSLACGHEGIDADHRCLFDIAERLRNASLQEQDNTVVANILRELLSYIQGHFAREEALMAAVNYPGFEDHRFEHSLLARHVRKLYQDFVDEKPIAYTDMWQFLRRWLRYHIMESDMHIARYVAKAKQPDAANEASLYPGAGS